jgi:hypothetical protein
MRHVCVCILIVLATDARGAADTLSVEQVRVVRDAVYDGKIIVYSSEELIDQYLYVPEPLTKLYKKHPSPVLDILFSIAEWGNPRDSILAAGYAFELLGGPGDGVACVNNFDKKRYDSLDTNWHRTPRALDEEAARAAQQAIAYGPKTRTGGRCSEKALAFLGASARRPTDPCCKPRRNHDGQSFPGFDEALALSTRAAARSTRRSSHRPMCFLPAACRHASPGCGAAKARAFIAREA